MKSIHLATLGCAALLALTPAQAQEPTTGGHIIALPQTPNTLVGTWRVTVSPDGIPPFRAYNIFYADGNSIEFDNSNAPGGQTIASGPWTRTGVNTYTFAEVNMLFDGQGNYQGELHVSGSITLDASGNTFASTFQFTVTDPTDMPVFQGGGTAKGVRASRALLFQ